MKQTKKIKYATMARLPFMLKLINSGKLKISKFHMDFLLDKNKNPTKERMDINDM